MHYWISFTYWMLLSEIYLWLKKWNIFNIFFHKINGDTIFSSSIQRIPFRLTFFMWWNVIIYFRQSCLTFIFPWIFLFHSCWIKVIFANRDLLLLVQYIFGFYIWANKWILLTFCSKINFITNNGITFAFWIWTWWNRFYIKRGCINIPILKFT